MTDHKQQYYCQNSQDYASDTKKKNKPVFKLAHTTQYETLFYKYVCAQVTLSLSTVFLAENYQPVTLQNSFQSSWLLAFFDRMSSLPIALQSLRITAVKE
jgi:hypothetical protein